VTDIPLLPDGEARVVATAKTVFGPHKLISPAKLGHILVSPRQRARQTLSLLFEAGGGSSVGDVVNGAIPDGIVVEVTNDIAEWGYGDYEGKLTSEIRAMRKAQGLDHERPWDIWVDGCVGEGGEMPREVTERLDRVIGRLREMQGQAMREKRDCDVLVVAHGHILRAFVKRWLGLPLGFGLDMMLEPGGVCGLSYQHGRVEEPAVLVGMSFPDGE
jgi:sedoheptulose-bisphosphatase